MMAFELTKAQRAAVEAQNKTLLLSAAAGSGKTATLTQRIITSLTRKDDPSDISRMLIVTFTRAAATELRERITAAISNALIDDPSNAHLNRQALLVGSADICTIDSFCLDVVRANFQRVTLPDGSPLSPDFRMADPSEISAIAISTMNSLIDEWYDKPTDTVNFAAFAENFATARDDGTIVEALIKFAESTASYKNADTFAKDASNDLFAAAESGEFFDSAAGQIIKELTRDTLLYSIPILQDSLDYLAGVPTADGKYCPAFIGDLEACRTALAAIDQGYAATKAALDDYLPLSLKTLGKYADAHTSYYKTMRDGIKSSLLSLRSTYYAYDGELLSKYISLSAENVAILDAFIKDYRARMAREKAMRRICDFEGVKRMAYDLLVAPDGAPTDIALSLREKYETVYIDEYQDVDPLQDAIFAAVARPDGRFMVGDIKQSIYGFRGSDPSIFGHYRSAFSPLEHEKASDGYSIFMSENFRCDRPIIDFTNIVSRATFGTAGGAVDYCDSDDLICGKGGDGVPVKLTFLMPKPRGDKTEYTVDKAEIRYIVNEISSLIGKERKNDGTYIAPGDIAILSRSGSFCSAVAEALALAEIPTMDAATKDYFENPEVLLILSIVSAIADPHRDIRLAGALRSPVFRFSMDELVRIRLASDSSCSLYEALCAYEAESALSEKCRAFEKELGGLRTKAYNLPIDRFVRELFDRFCLTALTVDGDTRSPEMIHDNILRFYEYARTFAQNRAFADIASFIKYIDDLIEAGISTETDSERSPDKVSIMTIHKSKGLEFPVVFVCGCGGKFSRKTLEGALLYDSDCGIGMQLTDETGFARVDTPVRTAVAHSISKRETEEEMRILYVALTRARERLYVTAKVSKRAYEAAQCDLYPTKYACRHSVLAAGGFIDWLMPIALSNHPSFELSVLNHEDIPDIQAKSAESGEATEISTEDIAEYKAIFEENFDRVYSHEASLSLPAKLSVSKLYPTVLDDDGATNLDEGSLPELVSKPLFMLDSGEEKERASAAERGTATHVFLQFCDFERAERSVRAELSRLTDDKFIPSGTAELVNLHQLEKFFESRLYCSIKTAKRVYREQRFNLLLPASSFTGSATLANELESENLLVQGVIDLVFEDQNGDITLCDYKTDYLTREELTDISLAQKKLSERHGEQLRYYAEAITRLFGREPKRICIYSLPLGDTVEI